MAQIAAHGHCEICSAVVNVGERFCGPECEAKHDEAQANKKKFIWKQVALLAALMLLLTAFNRGWI